jgi:allantoin racemase
MNLLLINPNSTQAITDRLTQQAGLHLPANSNLTGMTAYDGPPVVQSLADARDAEKALLTMSDRVPSDTDLIILGISLDIGLRSLQHQIGKPVIGLTQAALRQAAIIEEPIVCITVGSHLLGQFEQLSRDYGYDKGKVVWRAIDTENAFNASGPDELTAMALLEVATEISQQNPGATQIFVGAVLTGFSVRANNMLPQTLFIEPMQAACAWAVNLIERKKSAALGK